ncbi:Na+/H+ antiporter NhaA [Micromonospora fiedleri]|uniref:Na(+)/H(+) antiporter NhaA n=1 Tax=Micromonospora fiedleri TaxID=1157498 RepID=A0ABS1UP08_9ACTN|nr:MULTISPECIES: Na+/H+ antiporter NhaA [Micromonospora]MBL6278088.1 Na+/H+ antiporter NhaA [Micromonospora fiedleri]WSK41193.1 Na+/H+ antiporter NhaA [Micromonospora maris]
MTDHDPRPPHRGVRRLFSRTSWPEARFLADVLRTETVGGALLLVGAVIALIWANSPWGDTYTELGRWVPWPGGSTLHLDLDLATWAADGLLAVFFFVVGLELKREFVAGELRDPRRAALPVVAAVGGMALPALIYVAVNLTAGGEGLRGWAIPTATDIAFALAVLAVIGAYLPQGLRAFLLTLAVVDDLLAITVIAIFYTDDFNLLPLLGAVAPIALFALLVQRRRTWWWALIPLALVAWTLVHSSGVHATVAGVLLGFTVPVLAGKSRDGRPVPGLAERLEHTWRPISAGFAVPVFAFFAAGVSLRGADLGAVVSDPIVIGIVLGLVVGKTVGILGSTFLLARFTRARLDEDITWSDLLGVSMLAGIGFTVSLLIGELAFGAGSEAGANVKAAVLAGSLISALLASVVLVRRNRVYRMIALKEQVDLDQDGVPDVYQRPGG